MNVAFLLGTLDQGGAETMMLDIANKKEHLPFNACFIYRRDGSLTPSFNLSGAKIIRIERGCLLYLFSFVRQLRKFIRQEKIDLIHTHQRLDTILTRFSTIGLSAKSVQTIHGFGLHPGLSGFLLTYLSLISAHKNLFVSNYQMINYIKTYRLNNKINLSVLYNGIDFEKFRLRQTLTNPQTDNESPLLLGTVGNFSPGRDPLTICRFLRIIYEKGIDFYFMFIGKKDDKNPQIFRECLEYCLTYRFLDHVQFLGPRQDVTELLCHFNAFIYSTNSDTFSIAVMEAIASEIPVFVNDWPAIREVTGNGENAILYKSRDENDLAEKFLCFLADRNTYSIKAAKHAQWVRKRYNINQHLDGLSHIYKELVCPA